MQQLGCIYEFSLTLIRAFMLNYNVFSLSPLWFEHQIKSVTISIFILRRFWRFVMETKPKLEPIWAFYKSVTKIHKSSQILPVYDGVHKCHKKFVMDQWISCSVKSSPCSCSDGCTKMVVSQTAKPGIADNGTCFEIHLRCMCVLI